MAQTDAYKAAGVDVEAGYESVKLMKADVQRTFNQYVLSHLGGFGGLIELPEGYKKPVLVSGTDGVGTKLMIAFMMDKHDTIGIDAVAMCVNDILCQGARPLFFLDYIACGKNYPEKIAQIVSGVAEGCVQGGMALIGGETAEMPDMYSLDDYDLAGFAVGVVEKDEIITGQSIAEGDILVGLPSSGVHSNGFSLVRKLLFKDLKMDVHTKVDELGGTLGEALLTPTRIYVKAVEDLLKPYGVKGMSHVTGGGFYENIPRMIPDGLCAKVDVSAIDTLPIFKFIKEAGNITDEAMYSTFNMGIGLVSALPADQADGFVQALKDKGEKPVVLGEVVKGDEKIIL
ncbi:phosphoribosylformylglycinamidine cyclo-ligase [Eubacterium maltosivorans]|uniref:phosphoribosylformylglycinamidine cyclo-ligase n=1 Tax=Eubacterium maltosivorans TaxID=2041044 RepID=UPI0008889CB2|nr:phosphoribosylformylglycinamidine cyclo-ligase [Eubacterium maltosivorans]WPK79306.1 Phosphoribosylformylglycinamidine cyclo-ligase [Eubacterium maltosivorans]SDP83922.1 phosphoribosylformylglycinamidine cyclo-ligase [Eubacterium maltosivorans]